MTMTTSDMRYTNKLPQYWAVTNDGSELFKNTVVKYLNDLYECNLCIKDYYVYMVGKSGVWVTEPRNLGGTKMLTLQEFIKLSNEKLTEYDFLSMRKRLIYGH